MFGAVASFGKCLFCKKGGWVATKTNKKQKTKQKALPVIPAMRFWIFCMARWTPATTTKEELFALWIFFKDTKVPVMGIAEAYWIWSRCFWRIGWPSNKDFGGWIMDDR